eukprot:3689818-Karenia_brevis.AAC.1
MSVTILNGTPPRILCCPKPKCSGSKVSLLRKIFIIKFLPLSVEIRSPAVLNLSFSACTISPILTKLSATSTRSSAYAKQL